jgi:hypothetical protein
VSVFFFKFYVSTFSQAGSGIATVTFAGAHPINNIRSQSTLLEVQRCSDASCSSFEVVAVDGDWETRLKIEKHKSTIGGISRTWQVEWHVPAGTLASTYRIVVYGTSCKVPLIGKNTYTDFSGISNTFAVSV